MASLLSLLVSTENASAARFVDGKTRVGGSLKIEQVGYRLQSALLRGMTRGFSLVDVKTASGRAINENNWLQDIVYTGTSGIVASYSYTTAPTGHRTGVVEHTGRTVEYGYDELYRLTSERVTNDPSSVNGLTEYALDDVGNRLARTSTVMGIAAQVFAYNANDQVIGDSYDNNGNLLADGEGNAFQFDFDNRLSLVDASVALVHDGDGSVVEKSIGVDESRYLVDGRSPTSLTQIVELVGGSTYVFGTHLLAENDGVVLVDGQGNPRLLMTSSVVDDEGAFDAFGSALDALATDHGYMGEWTDDDVGLTFLRARYYQASTGRMISRDEALPLLWSPNTAHPFGYAGADPINNADPTGYQLESFTSTLTYMDAVANIGIVAPPVSSGGVAAFGIRPSTKEERQIAGLIFAEATAGIHGESPTEQEGIGAVVVNRAWVRSKLRVGRTSGGRPISLRCGDASFGDGTVWGAISAPGQFVSVGGPRWRLVMDGDDLKPDAVIGKTLNNATDHIHYAFSAASARAVGPKGPHFVGEIAGEKTLIGFNQSATITAGLPTRVEKITERIGSHYFEVYKDGVDPCKP